MLARASLLALLAATCLSSAFAGESAVEPAAVPSTTEPVVVFRRSCGECGDDSYCEFGFPDAPEGHVACVVHDVEDMVHLYRRYDPVGTPTVTVVGFAPAATANLGSTTDSVITSTFTLSNPGPIPYTVTNIAVAPAGQLARRGPIVATPGGTLLVEALGTRTVVSAGSTQTFQVTAQHTGTIAGTVSPAAVITVQATAATLPAQNPFTLTIKGTVVRYGATLSVFGFQNLGTATVSTTSTTEATKTLTVTNPGNGPLTITSIGLAGQTYAALRRRVFAANGAAFAVASPTPTVLLPGGSATMLVTVRYTAATTTLPPSATATLTIYATRTQATDLAINPTVFVLTLSGVVATPTPVP
ncbi:hypothetical protein DFJ74DRAFT_720545 [Hyaloraphidium curvatum]|nr:hypothetical protein DFJ74DRAFT_720545 [Hyaloraphidium curvatum]